MKIIETDKQYIIEGRVRCDDCKGTGLYQGFAEKDGAFVICLVCKGKGCVDIKITYDKFTTLRKEPRCKRVYSDGMGYTITDKDVTSEEKQFMPFSKYGCSYKEWLDGIKPKPLKFLGCPYLETNQSLQTKDKNNLYKTHCKDNISLGRSIKDCKLYKIRLNAGRSTKNEN
jgi:hypothetical protein